MGRKINKLFKKITQFYRYVFKFEIPYKVIIDGNILALSLQKKLDIKETLIKVLDENIYLVLTSCILNEIKEINKIIPGLLDIALKYKVEECRHNLLSPDLCIRTYIGKKNFNKYFVATQDHLLRKLLRKIPGTPIIYFDQNMFLLERPSIVSMDAYRKRENLKNQPKKFEKNELAKKKEEIKQINKEEYKQTNHYKRTIENYKINKVMGRVKKQAKGANPKSCQRKKIKDNGGKNYVSENNDGGNDESQKKKRKRVKKKKNNNI
jgi:U3 small nucleolar RNA-associated protein 23